MAQEDTAHMIADAVFARDGFVTRHHVGRMSEQVLGSVTGAAFEGLPSHPHHEHFACRTHIAI